RFPDGSGSELPDGTPHCGAPGVNPLVTALVSREFPAGPLGRSLASRVAGPPIRACDPSIDSSRGGGSGSGHPAPPPPTTSLENRVFPGTNRCRTIRWTPSSGVSIDAAWQDEDKASVHTNTIVNSGVKKPLVATEPRVVIPRCSISTSDNDKPTAKSPALAEMELLRSSLEDTRKNIEQINRFNLQLLEEISALRLLLQVNGEEARSREERALAKLAELKQHLRKEQQERENMAALLASLCDEPNNSAVSHSQHAEQQQQQTHAKLQQQNRRLEQPKQQQQQQDQ
uniref:Uncharacterized protein n=1 Tax=Anopheles maculatus TaxID=74869 RepID=A0A182SGQ5_9DIPT